MSEEAVQAAESEENAVPVEEELKEVLAEAATEQEAPVEVLESPAEAVAAPEAPVSERPAEPVTPEEVSYQAVEKEGTVTAIWEMQGRKHLRTIDPRSSEGKQILALFETAG